MASDSYQNSGLLTINQGARSVQRTIVVLGVARGGTSLVAGSLAELGVFMGRNAPPPVYEDIELGRAVESGAFDTAQRLVREYDAAHAVWAWKRPASLRQAERIHRLLRHPRYVVVFRDVFAIANRNRISMQANVLDDMAGSIEAYATLLDFLRRARPPALLVSYDKALRDKARFIDQLCDFADLHPSAAARDRALAFITPSPAAYLDATRGDRVVGHLDVITPDKVFGWAARQQSPDQRPLQVRLSVNDRPVATTRADRPRPDLVAHGAHRTGRAGFEFELRPPDRIRPGDRVAVHAGDELVELAHSPQVFEGPKG